MRRKRWVALIILPVLLLVGDFFYWRLAVVQLRDGFEAWTRQARAAGWDVRYSAISTGGWPDAATLRVDNITLRAVSLFGQGRMSVGALHLDSVSMGSDAIRLSTKLTRPSTLELSPVGVGGFRLNDGPAIPVSADHMHLWIALRPNAPPRSVEFDAVTLAAEIPGLGMVRIGRLNGRADPKPALGRNQAVVSFALSIQSVALPDGVHWGLGPDIGEFAADGVLNGPLPPGGFLGGQGLTAQATVWRDEGGSLELHRLAIGWGKARLDATATLALDEELQPMGAGTGKIGGYNTALDVLAAKAVLTRSAAKAAKAVLALVANTPAEGEPEEVEVPLTLQFRTLSVRQVPLLRLPEVDWPGR